MEVLYSGDHLTLSREQGAKLLVPARAIWSTALPLDKEREPGGRLDSVHTPYRSREGKAMGGKTSPVTTALGSRGSDQIIMSTSLGQVAGTRRPGGTMVGS